MKILVLMKMVPDIVEELEVSDDGSSLDQEYLRFIVNERDDYALEQALLLRDSLQAEVTVVAPEAPEVDDVLYTALAKGASPRTVIWKHALKVAVLPVLSFLGPATAQAMTGSFVVEKVFGVPGIGQHFVNAALNRDAGLVMSTVLVFATLLVAFNLIVDVLYTRLDPRISEAV